MGRQILNVFSGRKYGERRRVGRRGKEKRERRRRKRRRKKHT